MKALLVCYVWNIIVVMFLESDKAKRNDFFSLKFHAMTSWVIVKSFTECAAAGFAKGNVGDFPYTGSYWTG